MIEAARAAGAADRSEDDDFDPDGTGRRRQPVRHAGGRAHPGGRRLGLRRRQARVARVPIAARSPTPASSWRCPTRSSRSRSAPSGSSRKAPSPGCVPAGCSNDSPVPRSPRSSSRRLGHRSRSRSRRDRQRQAVAVARAARSARPATDRDQPAAALPGRPRLPLATSGTSTRGSSRPSPRSRRPRASRWRIGSSGYARRCAAHGRTSARRYTAFRDASSARSLAIDGRHRRVQPLRRDQRRHRRRRPATIDWSSAASTTARSPWSTSSTARYSLLKVATRPTP